MSPFLLRLVLAGSLVRFQAHRDLRSRSSSMLAPSPSGTGTDTRAPLQARARALLLVRLSEQRQQQLSLLLFGRRERALEPAAGPSASASSAASAAEVICSSARSRRARATAASRSAGHADARHERDDRLPAGCAFTRLHSCSRARATGEYRALHRRDARQLSRAPRPRHFALALRLRLACPLEFTTAAHSLAATHADSRFVLINESFSSIVKQVLVICVIRNSKYCT